MTTSRELKELSKNWISSVKLWDALYNSDPFSDD